MRNPGLVYFSSVSLWPNCTLAISNHMCLQLTVFSNFLSKSEPMAKSDFIQTPFAVVGWGWGTVHCFSFCFETGPLCIIRTTLELPCLCLQLLGLKAGASTPSLEVWFLFCCCSGFFLFHMYKCFVCMCVCAQHLCLQSPEKYTRSPN